MNPTQHRWHLSSSNLRICLKLFQNFHMTQTVTVAQFEWITFQNSWYLYNNRSTLILATARISGGTILIRYRERSRYRHIIQEWAEAYPPGSGEVIAMASNHVGRWERRMRYLRRGTTATREMAIESYAVRILGWANLNERYPHDNLSRVVTPATTQSNPPIVLDPALVDQYYNELVAAPESFRDRMRSVQGDWEIRPQTIAVDEDDSFPVDAP